MLFNSPEYIFLFLPIVWLVYFALNRKHLTLAAKSWLVLASLFFYSWWNLSYLALILTSVFVNFGVGTVFAKGKIEGAFSKKAVLGVGIAFNLALLGYYKYTDFFIENLNALFGFELHFLHLVLPLAISFFTFQQMAYLVDSYRGLTKEYDFLTYTLFVTFFPQLIAGPIVHHKEMIPQFQQTRNKLVNYRHVAKGLFIFSMGLFKKVVVADTLSPLVGRGFDIATDLSMLEGWVTALAYTLQLYYDFSGYTDMAIGAALLFNIRLPINFFSPYKALTIQQFWRQWHVTLSRFLKAYLYIPLGGSKLGSFRTSVAILITFVVGGVWHGAGWTFVFWGALHGVGLVVYRVWQRVGIQFPRFLSWAMTFVFVTVGWVFFRAKTWGDALKVLKAMFSIEALILPKRLESVLAPLSRFGVSFGSPFDALLLTYTLLGGIVGMFGVAVLARNSNEWLDRFQLNRRYLVWMVALFLTSFVFGAYLTIQTEFIYFQF